MNKKMNIKKIMKTIIIVIVTILVLCFGIYFIQNKTLTNSFVSYNEDQGRDSFIRCNLNILKPEFASIFYALDKGHIGFKETNIFSQTNEEWKNSHVGGATVYNVTFKELVEMVKEDCNQFKKSKGDFRDEEINWSYGKYNPTPNKTPEEIKQREEELKEYYRKLESGEIEPAKPLEGFVEYNEDGTIK